MEPHPKSHTKLRDKIREKLNHWTLWRAADEVIPELNPLLKGWGGYFHYANSTRVFDRMNQYVVSRVPRWLWREGGGARNLWTPPPREELQERWGLYRLPTLGGVATGTGVEAMRVNGPRRAGCRNLHLIRYNDATDKKRSEKSASFRLLFVMHPGPYMILVS